MLPLCWLLKRKEELVPLCPTYQAGCFTWSQPCLPLNSSFLHAEAGVHGGLGGCQEKPQVFIVPLGGGERGANAPESTGKKHLESQEEHTLKPGA